MFWYLRLSAEYWEVSINFENWKRVAWVQASIFVLRRARYVSRMRRPTGIIQEVTGSILRSGTIFRRDNWSWNNFYGHSLPTAESCMAVVSYWRKYGHLVLVNRLGSLPRNSVDRLTDRDRNDLNSVEKQ